jgi:hypothetical protein
MKIVRLISHLNRHALRLCVSVRRQNNIEQADYNGKEQTRFLHSFSSEKEWTSNHEPQLS